MTKAMFDLDECEKQIRKMFDEITFPQDGTPGPRYMAQSAEAVVQVNRVTLTIANDGGTVNDAAEWFSVFVANVLIDLFKPAPKADVMHYYLGFVDDLMSMLATHTRGEAQTLGSVEHVNRTIN